MTFIHSPRWAIRLWLVWARWISCSRHFTVAMRWHNVIGYQPRFERIVDRLCPWVPQVGYKRSLLRRVLYTVRFIRYRIPVWYWQAACSLLTRFAPYVGPGRFEGFYDPRDAIKAEWLVDHNEYATFEAGDFETGDMIHTWVFEDLAVPWTREPETWIVWTDQQGFVSASMVAGQLLHCDLCPRVEVADDLTPDWDGETGNHRSCMEQAMAERDPSEVYGTREHEDWLIFMEQQEG